MALNHSPSIVTNGLIFAYDMSNTKKSWKGKPATNLIITKVENYTGWGGAGWWLHPGNTVSVTNQDLPDGNIGSVFNVTSLASGGLYGYNSYALGAAYVNGTQYTVSFWARSFNGTPSITVRDADAGGTLNSAVSGITNFWQRFSFTWTANASTNMVTFTGSNFSLKDVQLETNSFASPFVSGTRSTTNNIVDLTGGNNTITANSLTYASDNTFNFNGSANYLDCGTGGALTLGNNGTFTASAWVKVSTLKNYSGIISKVQSNRGGVYSFMCVVHNDGTIGFYNNAGWYWSSNAGITTNTWYNVVFSFNGSVMSYYVNGVAYGTSTLTWPETTSHKVFVGSWYSPNTIYDFNGTIAIAQLYNRALFASEVQQNFNAIRRRYGI